MKSRTSLTISIPTPCKMKWEEMNFVDKNRKHCPSCDRVIVDFTKMSDEELLDYFKQNKNACGQLAPHQLNRKIFAQADPKNSLSWKNFLIVPSLLLGIESFSQQKAEVGKSNSATFFSAPNTSNGTSIVSANQNVAAGDSIIVQGIVKDSATQEPILFANVLLQDANGVNRGCTTDENGKFLFEIPNTNDSSVLTLSVRMIGYGDYSAKVPISNSFNKIELTASPQIMMLGGAITTIAPYPYKYSLRSRIRWFFYRVFHPFR